MTTSSATLQDLLELQDAHYELFQRYTVGGTSTYDAEMKEVYEIFYNKVNERFKARLEFHKIAIDEFQRRWEAQDETLRQDPVLKDINEFRDEISSFEKFALFMRTHADVVVNDMPDDMELSMHSSKSPEADVSPIVQRENYAISVAEAAEQRIFAAASDKEILVYWDTENVPPSQCPTDSINLLRNFIRENKIGNPLKMWVEAFFCPQLTEGTKILTLNPKQMWGLRQAGVSMIACTERKKEEVDRQMERHIRRECTRTDPKKSIFVIISGDSDFNQVVQDVAVYGFEVHLLTNNDHPTVHPGPEIKVWMNFTMLPPRNDTSSCPPSGRATPEPQPNYQGPAAPAGQPQTNTRVSGSGSPTLHPQNLSAPQTGVVEAVNNNPSSPVPGKKKRKGLMQRQPTREQPIDVDIPQNLFQGRTQQVTCSRFLVKWWKGNSGVIVSPDEGKEIFAVGGAFMDRGAFTASKNDFVNRYVLLYPSIARMSWNEERKNFNLQLPPPCLDIEVFTVIWVNNDDAPTMAIMRPIVTGHPYPYVFVTESLMVNKTVKFFKGLNLVVKAHERKALDFKLEEKHGNYRLYSAGPCLEVNLTSGK